MLGPTVSSVAGTAWPSEAPSSVFSFIMPVSGQVHARGPGFAASKTFHLVTAPSGGVRGREVNNPNSGSGIPLLE